MPEREFELYLSVLSRLLRLSPQQKDSIADELRDHLEERFEALVRSGVPRDDAIRQALDEFGDAAGLAVDFTAVSKKRIRRLIMRSTAAATALIAVVAFFLTDAGPQQPGVPDLPGVATASAESDPPKVIKSDSQIRDTPKPPELEPPKLISGPPLVPTELDDWTRLEFVDVPLLDAAAFISDLHDFPVVLDKQALDDSGISTDVPITINIADPPALVKALANRDLAPKEEQKIRERFSDSRVALHQALDWILRPLDLSWYVEDEVLHITSLNGELERHIVRSYSARHLLQSGIPSDSLADTIRVMTNGHWVDTDGTGGSLSVVGDVLTIRHSFQMHRQVESLLAALSRRSPWHYVTLPRRHVRQLELLETRIGDIQFQDAPLTEVLEYLSDLVAAPIRTDRRRMEDQGLSGDEPVTLQLRDRPLRTGLKLMLERLNLQVVVQDGALTVTTKSGAEDESSLHTAVYDVRELESASGPRGLTDSRLDALVDAIQNTSGFWQNLDGDGGSLLTPGGGRLVVRQTDEVHAEIRNLLSAHRQLLGEAKRTKGDPEPPPVSQVELRFYRVPSESADDLLMTIPELVAPQTWVGPARPEDPVAIGTIRKVAVGSRVVEPPGKKTGNEKKETSSETSNRPDRTVVQETVLIIRNSRAVHTQIDELMNSLGLDARGVSPGKAPQVGGGFF